METTSAGTVVGDVSVVSDCPLTYANTEGIFAEAFEIDMNTGILSVLDSGLLDYEVISVDTLTITVRNGNSEDTEISVVITIEDVYEPVGDADPNRSVVILTPGGGFDANSGNEGYSSQVTGMVSMAGHLYDLSRIKAGDPPIMCIHGTNDKKVPIDFKVGDHSFLTEETYPGISDEITTFIWENRR